MGKALSPWTRALECRRRRSACEGPPQAGETPVVAVTPLLPSTTATPPPALPTYTSSSILLSLPLPHSPISTGSSAPEQGTLLPLTSAPRGPYMVAHRSVCSAPDGSKAEKEKMSANRFSGELRAVTSVSAVTDEVGKSDGQLQSFLSLQACLALTLCAMFSEGTRHSAVTQTDRQMVHIDAEHERDWQSSNRSLGGPS
ncbi:unnamed protein product [Pleuronectes platessa]|uniref:Uncharacterized protein n=1 Tax=Pleuronectes platessa TaxID=8262 RepID=A0A9N7VW45_PLEPL|nr:unnamed protein product [Pleuronectes platessa]